MNYISASVNFMLAFKAFDCMVVRTGYKDPLSETNVRVLGCVSTYKEFFEIGAQLPSQVVPTCDS